MHFAKGIPPVSKYLLKNGQYQSRVNSVGGVGVCVSYSSQDVSTQFQLSLTCDLQLLFFPKSLQG